jgi:hypothetical protein
VEAERRRLKAEVEGGTSKAEVETLKAGSDASGLLD